MSGLGFGGLSAVVERAKEKIYDTAESARQSYQGYSARDETLRTPNTRMTHSAPPSRPASRSPSQNPPERHRPAEDTAARVSGGERETPPVPLAVAPPAPTPTPPPAEMDLLAMSPERKPETGATADLMGLSLGAPDPQQGQGHARTQGGQRQMQVPSAELLDFGSGGQALQLPAQSRDFDTMDTMLSNMGSTKHLEDPLDDPLDSFMNPTASQAQQTNRNSGPAPLPRPSDPTLISFEEKPAPVTVATDEIDLQQITHVKKIGAGAFAEVMLCEWRGTPVALKQVLPDKLSEAAMADFRQEAELLQKLRHPNVVMYMGSNITPPNLFIMTEFCPNGTLFNLLHSSKTQLDTPRKASMALDIARGLAYLHGFRPALIHRDVKSLNVLVDSNLNCKVSDFGLTVSSGQSNTLKCGTYQYMAPELFSGVHHYNEKVDVYAFGILLWELFSRSLPYSDMLGEQVPMAVSRGHRPSMPEDCPPFIKTLLQACWHANPSSRPSMAEVVTQLKQVTSRMGEMFGL